VNTARAPGSCTAIWSASASELTDERLVAPDGPLDE
jgi:hypothetical protein